MEASQKSGHRLLTDGKHAGQYMVKYNLYLTPEESDALAARRVQLALVPVPPTPDEAFQEMVTLTEQLGLYDAKTPDDLDAMLEEIASKAETAAAYLRALQREEDGR